MKRLIGATSLALLIATGPASAVEPELGAKLGTSADTISKALKESGYEMTKYERERREIEVKARKGDRYVEVKIDPRSGEVYEVEEKYRRRDDDRRYRDDDRRYDDDKRRGDDS
jgi:hypothetical protein